MQTADDGSSDLNEALLQLMRTSQVISNVITESIENVEDELSLPQLRTLELVATWPEISATEAVNIQGPKTTVLIDRLVQGGYLNRSDSAGDQRGTQLTLTGAGLDLLAEVMEHRRHRFERLLRQMTAADWRPLAAALHAFAICADDPKQDGYII